MLDYEEQALRELTKWKRKMAKKPSMLNQWSKQVQSKINHLIPSKVHVVITESIKKMVEVSLFGSAYFTKNLPTPVSSLEEKEEIISKRLAYYKKTAALEGAGTGAGGLLLGIADFPLLLSIKMKFIFDAAAIYGFDRNSYEERVFMLYIFQLAFSSDERKKEVLQKITNWKKEKEKVVQFDWKQFQQEYRDYLDVVKLLQLVPGVGAFVGAYVNYHMLDSLGEAVSNCYRIRLFDNKLK